MNEQSNTINLLKDRRMLTIFSISFIMIALLVLYGRQLDDELASEIEEV